MGVYERMKRDSNSLEEIMHDAARIKKKTGKADALSSVTFSLLIGPGLDYISGMRTLGEIALSRLLNGTSSLATSVHYGRWRDYLFRKTNTHTTSSLLRQKAVELLAFDTFGGASYSVCSAIVHIGYRLFSHEEPNAQMFVDGLHHAWKAYTSILLISLPMSVAYGWYMDAVRNLFNLPSAAEKSDRYASNTVPNNKSNSHSNVA